jgi:hypothetical protein
MVISRAYFFIFREEKCAKQVREIELKCPG